MWVRLNLQIKGVPPLSGALIFFCLPSTRTSTAGTASVGGVLGYHLPCLRHSPRSPIRYSTSGAGEKRPLLGTQTANGTDSLSLRDLANHATSFEAGRVPQDELRSLRRLRDRCAPY